MERIDNTPLSDSGERTDLARKLRAGCERLLEKYGQTKKGPRKIIQAVQGLRQRVGGKPPGRETKVLTTKVLSPDGKEIDISVASSSPDPSTSEFISVILERTLDELWLRKDDALFLENWGMGENIYEKEVITEHFENQERDYDNPRPATLEELHSAKWIFDGLSEKYPI